MSITTSSPVRLLLCLLGFLSVVIALPAHDNGDLYMPHQRRAMAGPRHHLSLRSMNVSSIALRNAQDLVVAAVARQSEYNAYRVAHPRRNTYTSRHSAASTASRKRSDEPAAPRLDDSLRAAAALLAEHSARQQAANGTLHRSYNNFRDLPRPLTVSKRDTADAAKPYWPALVDHGRPSMGADPSYPVYRDVTDPKFGAKGDGVTDDTAAINKAIAYGNNCEENCMSSTVKSTFIYFPPGTYLISTPINAAYYSQLVGDPNDLPIIKTAPHFIGLGAIQTDVYVPNASGGEWYIEQSNFYRQVRNFVIDITDTTTDHTAGLHWQVAQATSLTNVYISASTKAGNTQMGMFTENGSGGFMSDCIITGGAFGIYGGNQQYTVRHFQIADQGNASICLLWDWGWTWADMYLTNAPVGVMLIDPEPGATQQSGSTYFLDTHFAQMKTGILASFEKDNMLNTSVITLNNVGITDVDTFIRFSDGKSLQLLEKAIDLIILGNVKGFGLSLEPMYNRFMGQQPVPELLSASTLGLFRQTYFYKSRPQYETLASGDIISVKSHGAKGDGAHDDTDAIKAALALATKDNLIYFPPGSYVVTSTIVIPPHARLTGQVWSQIVASGAAFADMAKPTVMVKVGNAGDVGTVEISDLLFTSIGNLPGLVLMEWNVQAEKQGSVGMWDAHFRIGGAYGTKLQVAQCPGSASLNSKDCVAANTIMHMTPGSNGYFENMWLWVADHDIDDATNTQISVAVARGLLLDSTSGPTWLYGTASEHSMLYQYNFNNATNVFAGMIQTESPYFQFAPGLAQSPGPFNESVGTFAADPVFPDTSCDASSALCDFSWAVILQENTNVTVAGAGLYSWYDNYQEECVDTQNCQQRLLLDAGYNAGVFVFNLVTIGAVEMVSNVEDGDVVYAANNTQAFGHPYWSALAAYMVDADQPGYICDDDDTSEACMVSWKCDISQSYASVEDLSAALSSHPNQCMPYYAVRTLYNVLRDSMANYTTTNDDYDKYFKYYQEYIRENVPSALDAFMKEGGPGNKYFDCTWKDSDPPKTQQCPFTHDQVSGVTSFEIEYQLKDADGFFAELQSTYGINKTWVVFEDKVKRSKPSPCHPGECSDAYDYEWLNFPQPADSKTMQVSNPKDIMTAALPSISGMQDSLLATLLDINFGYFDGSMQDVLDTYSLPVFMIQQAVESMAVVKNLGEKQAAADKKKLVLEILGAVFAFLPFVDEFAPALEIMDGVFATVALAGNVALDIQGIISDPTSAPMLLLDLVGGRGGARPTTGDEFAKTGTAARALKEGDLAAIGNDFKAKQDKFRDETTPKCDL